MPEEKLKEVQSYIQYIMFRDAGNAIMAPLTEDAIVEQFTKSMDKSDSGVTTPASVISQRMMEKYVIDNHHALNTLDYLLITHRLLNLGNPVFMRF